MKLQLWLLAVQPASQHWLVSSSGGLSAVAVACQQWQWQWLVSSGSGSGSGLLAVAVAVAVAVAAAAAVVVACWQWLVSALQVRLVSAYGYLSLHFMLSERTSLKLLMTHSIACPID